jgi:hypothetical protein
MLFNNDKLYKNAILYLISFTYKWIQVLLKHQVRIKISQPYPNLQIMRANVLGRALVLNLVTKI